MMSDASGSGTVTPNFFQFLILVMVLGVSGQLSPNITGGNLSLSSFGVSGHLWMPVGLSGVALVLGTAFGAYWFARKFAIRFKWTGIVSSVIVGVVMGFVYLILAAIFPLTLGAGSMGGIQAKAILTGVSARTYFMSCCSPRSARSSAICSPSTPRIPTTCSPRLGSGSPHARLRAHVA